MSDIREAWEMARRNRMQRWSRITLGIGLTGMALGFVAAYFTRSA